MSLSLIIDIGVILIILVSAGVSFFRGFVREVLTIFGVIGGGLAAYTFGGRLSPVFRSWLGVEDGKEPEKLFDLIPYTYVADICAYAVIFIVVFLVLQLISYFMSASVRAVGLGPVDRTLGVVFGVARALLFLGIIYAVLGQIIPDKEREDILGNSKTIVYVEAVADWVRGFFPEGSAEDAKEKVQDFANDKLNDLKESKAASDANEPGEPEGGEAPGYSDRARDRMNDLIQDQNTPLQTEPVQPDPVQPDPDPKLPERPGFNE